VRALSEYQKRAEGEGIAGFLSEISFDQNLADEASEEDAVTLITIHAAKGLARYATRNGNFVLV
jgi:superfamily I DNA/RNA helicase